MLQDNLNKPEVSAFDYTVRTGTYKYMLTEVPISVCMSVHLHQNDSACTVNQ